MSSRVSSRIWALELANRVVTAPPSSLATMASLSGSLTVLRLAIAESAPASGPERIPEASPR